MKGADRLINGKTDHETVVELVQRIKACEDRLEAMKKDHDWAVARLKSQMPQPQAGYSLARPPHRPGYRD